MYKHGHYGAALLLAAPVTFIVASSYTTLGAAFIPVLAVATARLPDIDVMLPVSHRGITHTAAFMIATTIAVTATTAVTAPITTLFNTPLLLLIALGVTTGITSHLLADIITPSGIPIWYPVTARRVSGNIVTAKNPAANYAFLITGLTAITLTLLTV